jgi:hypothetical protein
MATKDIVDVVSKIITALATILAGGWAYYRFVKGRVFKPRLTLTAKARQLHIRTTEYVLSTIELSNVGLSRVDIDSATLRVCSLLGNAIAETVSVPQRVWLDTCRVLLAHRWIESGEVVNEQNLLTLPLNHSSPILIDFRVVAQGVSLTVTAIAEPTATAIAELAHADALNAGERPSL